jgi:hypothetical protein
MQRVKDPLPRGDTLEGALGDPMRLISTRRGGSAARRSATSSVISVPLVRSVTRNPLALACS